MRSAREPRCFRDVDEATGLNRLAMSIRWTRKSPHPVFSMTVEAVARRHPHSNASVMGSKAGGGSTNVPCHCYCRALVL